MRVQAVFDWLVNGAPGSTTSVEVVTRLGADLGRAGVPVDRMEAFVRTLHPHLVGRSFHWTPGQVAEAHEVTYAYLESPGFLGNPVAEVFKTGQAVRRRLDQATGFELLDGLTRAGFTDYVAMPLRFLSGQVHAISFATRGAAGFSDDQLADLRTVLAPLSRIAEILALGRTAANLLNTYVGHDAGERILAGQIQRGDTNSLGAVLWNSDLRGYTSLSAELPPGGIIRMLNELFDCQVPAIERNGGEVLKFMGDGLLAIFPLGMTDPAERCEQALAVADEAFAALARLNVRRTQAAEPPLKFGLALHVGEVSYGNIGGSGRLDFTCIGPAVNLVSRLEGLTGKLAEPLIVSAEFARLLERPARSLGRFELKGVAGPTEVFVPESKSA